MIIVYWTLQNNLYARVNYVAREIAVSTSHAVCELYYFSTLNFHRPFKLDIS